MVVAAASAAAASRLAATLPQTHVLLSWVAGLDQLIDRYI
jgi:hypothetical protein